MIKAIFIALFLSLTTVAFVQAQSTDSIPEKEVSRIIHVLASDSFKGRGNLQPELLKAATFIADEFRNSQLLPLPGFPGYCIPFQPRGGLVVATDALTWNDSLLPDDRFLYLHTRPGPYPAKSLTEFTVIRLDSFFSSDVLQQQPGKDLLIWTDKLQPGGTIFPKVLRPPAAGLAQNILLVYAKEAPRSIRLEPLPGYGVVGYNIAAVLPGRSKAGEIVLFSSHYDHLGTEGRKADTIFNGANDNASGTTGLLMLAAYFARRNDNERTLLFCAFAGEEWGLKGSKDIIQYIDPDKIVAAINLEMIGIPQYGKKRVFITGEQYSYLPALLRKGFKNTDLRVRPEPDEIKQLFMRSDNYPFAQEGIPAHTIMASDDDDKCYHQPCDEVKRIDIGNMTSIIRAIAVATAGLINGKETPGRINTRELP